MRLLIQPGDGISPLVKGINGAKRSVEIVIFRFDRSELGRALANAVKRGVFVHALIAHMNRFGEENLRKLEMQLLEAGVTVARTADDLARYHDKLMIVDRTTLYLFAFNVTYLDIERSRSFGIVTTNRRVVQEAVKLFEADTKRRPYEPGLASFVVSPVNARKELSALIQGAKSELLIYDPKVSDPAMIRILEDRGKAGVDVKILGQVTRRSCRLAVRKLARMRLHTRTIIQDGRRAFVGSQSLRELELDGRREVGLIFSDSNVVNKLVNTFRQDWDASENAKQTDLGDDTAPAARVAKRVAKAVAKDLPPMAPVLDMIVREIESEGASVELNAREVEDTVKDAVRQAVREVVRDSIEEVVEHQEDEPTQ